MTLPEAALLSCAQETRRVEEALGPLARAARFPRGEGLHFTLKFLGPTPDERVAQVREALGQAAREAEPFPLTLGGLQSFPSSKKPRVVFLGVREGGAPMIALAQAVERHVSPLGFASEARAFVPHVTLARIKDFKAAPKIGERLQTLAAVEVARVQVADVALMLSELGPAGSRYTALARFPLGHLSVSTSS